MAILKCKMCGGDLEISEGVSVCECEYCGTKQTVPSADNEKKMALFGRANRLRFGNEFDKAAGVYESIVAEFPEEAEAYWGLVLCKYGIEYVDDSATSKKIPTCHRSSFESVMDDSNYEQTLENADTLARGVYRDEAKQIEELRKGIIEVSSKEEPYDIFICYKETAENGDRTIDSVIAQDVYNALTEKGYRVFFSRISLEDKLGVEYEPYIFAALNSAKIMLAFGTDYEYYNAVWVKNEWSRFLQLIAKGEKKTLIPCYKDIDAYDMPKEFAKLQAQDMGKVGAIQDLLRGVEKILPKNNKNVETINVQQSAQAAPNVDSLLERAFMFLEDGKWDDANTYCDKVLDIDPKCARAYLGKLMAELHVDKQEKLSNCEKPFDKNEHFQKIIRFGDENLISTLKEYINQINDRNENARLTGIYNKAATAMNQAKSEADYRKAAEIFQSIIGFNNADERVKECLEKAETCKKKEAAERARQLEIIPQKHKEAQIFKNMIYTSWDYTLGLREDGTVLTAGGRNEDEIKHLHAVSNWKNVKKIYGGFGVTKDGRVLPLFPKANECTRVIRNWRNVEQMAFGDAHYVALCKDGTVKSAIPSYGYHRGQCNTQNWKNIIAIDCGEAHTVGLRSDGTVVACGENGDGRCNVQNWKNISQIVCGGEFTLGLKTDGTVVATGNNEEGQCNVSSWRNIMALYTPYDSIKGCHDKYSPITYGLSYDGKILCTAAERCKRKNDMQNYNNYYNFEEIDDAVDIVANGCHTAIMRSDGRWCQRGIGQESEKILKNELLAVCLRSSAIIGLKRDGTVIALDTTRSSKYKKNEYGQLDVQGWKLFDNADNFIRQKEEQEKQKQLENERRKKGLCPYCGGEYKKGLFSTKCVSCGKSKDY